MKDLTTGNEARLIFNFALPMLIGNVFQQLYTSVDGIIVGRVLGKGALAAVGISFPVTFLLISLIMGVAMGTTILIAQYYGAGEMKKVKRTIDTAYIFLAVASLIITVVGLLLSGPILTLLKVPADVYPLAKQYLNIIFIGITAMFGYNSISAILRGLGNSKTPLYFLIIATLMNIGLDLLFIIVFKWGVAGAAWATIIAQAFSFLIGIVYLNRTHELFRFNLREMKFDREIFSLTFRIGLPNGIQHVMLSAGFMTLFRIVNEFGTAVTAAYTAATGIDSFASMPAMNLSMAVSSFVGQNLGANKPERVKRGHLAALGMSVAISLVMTAVAILLRKELISLYNMDPEVIYHGSRYLLIVGSFYVVFSVFFTTNGVLRGAGDTLTPLISTILSLWLIRVPAAALLSQKLGPDGIWWAGPVGMVTGMVFTVLYYRSGRWKKKVVVQKAAALEMAEPAEPR